MPFIVTCPDRHARRPYDLRAQRPARTPSKRAWALIPLLCSALASAPAAEEQSVTSPSSVTSTDLMERGSADFRAGDFIGARLAWEEAARGFQEVGDSQARARALARSGEASLAIGQHPRAIETLTVAEEIAVSTGDPRLEASVADSLGTAYRLAGRPDRAEPLLRHSVTLGKRSADNAIVASASNNLGNLLAIEGRPEEAKAAYRDALEAAGIAGQSELAARASANLARVLVETARYDKAAEQLARSLERLQRSPASHQKAYSLISVGRLFTQIAFSSAASSERAGRGAHRSLSEASDIAEQLDDQRAGSYALGYLGNLYEKTDRYGDALRLTQQAIFRAQRADAKEALYRWQWQSGRILAAQGEDEQAIVSYQQAVYTLESIRQDVNAGLRARQASFREAAGPVYFELADLLLQRSARANAGAERARDLVDARQTVELLKGAELEDYFQDDCVAALQAKTTGIDRLENRTAAIYPIILKDRTELLLSLPDGLAQITVDVDRETLTAEIRAFRSKLEKRTTHEYYPHARQLYDWLFLPIEPELVKRDIETVVIVPDGPMRTIPLAALHDGENFLGARFALATTPGLTLTDPRPIERKDVELLANGLSVSVQGFPSLPNVDDEIASIEELYGGTVLKNQAFVVANMERELSVRPFSIVHIASHGQFDSEVDNTFLLTYDGKLSMNALEQFIASTKFREDPVELLTLSACQTAAGDDRAALGLAGIAVKAGARSAVATLWTVNDPASAALVTEFYEQLKDPQVSKAQALQRAQLKLSEDLRYWHPSYWSPFLLIGNWL